MNTIILNSFTSHKSLDCRAGIVSDETVADDGIIETGGEDGIDTKVGSEEPKIFPRESEETA